MKKLVLVDANNLLYRAFFAVQSLTTSEGTPTNAVYGYTNMLLRLLEEERPDLIVVVWDGGTTFRHEAFPGYKLQRPRVPDDLAVQAPIAREMTRALGMPQIERPGYEADDVIGTLACAGSRAGYQVRIVTGDLDALQLVDGEVRVIAHRPGRQEAVVYDAAAVREKLGVGPEKVPDYKALSGDSSDNIPGARGIGPKTAAQLLSEYGSVEALLERLPEMPEGRVRRSLEEAGRNLLLYKGLATIVTDLPLEPEWEAWSYRGPDQAHARELFGRLEFRTLLRRLPDDRSPSPGTTPPVPEAGWEVQRAADAAALTAWLEQHAPPGSPLALRLLTPRLAQHGGDAEGLALATADGQAIVFVPGAGDAETGGRGDAETRRRGDAETGGDELAGVEGAESATGGETPALRVSASPRLRVSASSLPPLLQAALGDGRVRLVGHNLKQDVHTLWRAGVGGVAPEFDTMVAAYLLNPGRSNYRLSDLAREQFGLVLEEVEDPVERLGLEAAAIGRLRPALEERLEGEGLAALNRELEIPLIGLLARMERVGVAVDPLWLNTLSERLAGRIAEIQAQIYALAGREFNVGSPKQLQEVLFNEMGLPAGKRTKTGLSTGVEVLEELAAEHPIVRLILDYRELAKLKSTYADALPKLADAEGRIHTSLNQTVAATGRLSSSEPNLQNIPIRTELGREIRQAFVPAPGMRLLSADYSQIELRILAHVTGDPALTEAFRADEDIHTLSAARLYGVEAAEVTAEQRRRAKTITFAVLYGMSDFGLSKELGIPVKTARELIDAYFARFPGVRRYTVEMIETARKQGYVSTLSGRKRYMPDIRSANRNFRAMAERAAVNAPIQGTAADIIKRAMVALDEEMQREGFRSRMILQVHDELLFEAVPEELPPLAERVRAQMEAAFSMDVPLRVEVKVGDNWRDVTPWEG